MQVKRNTQAMMQSFFNRLKENNKSQTGTANTYAATPGVEPDADEYAAFEENTGTSFRKPC